MSPTKIALGTFRYTFGVRRIYQIGTLFLLLSLFLAPVFECFDRWDLPGLGNDTEMAAFGLVLLLCLLLAVCKLIPGLADRIGVVLSAMVRPERSSPLYKGCGFTCKLVVPPILTPLRI